MVRRSGLAWCVAPLLAVLFSAAECMTAPVFNDDNRHYYDYVETSVTWSQARDMAAAMEFNGLQGYLATITSTEENDFVIENFFKQGFLGGNDVEEEGDWRWVTGPEAGQLFFRGQYPDPNRQTFIYADWGGNEPNDYDNTIHGFLYPGEDFLAFDTIFGGEWNDVPGDPYTLPGFYVEFGSAVPEPTALIVWSHLGTIAVVAGWWRRGNSRRRTPRPPGPGPADTPWASRRGA